MDAAIRCTVSTCGCDRYAPRGPALLRQCVKCDHGWVVHAIGKLGLPPQEGVPGEMVQPHSAFDVASLVLYGAQAIPVRLKIPLDRLFAALRPEDVEKLLGSFGWTDKDYHRGYIAQDKEGNALDKWSLTSRDEEPLILQQFLKFGETRSVAQQLLNQTCQKDDSFSSGSFSDIMDVKRLIDRKGIVRPPSLVLPPAHTGSVSSLSPIDSPPSVSPLNKLQNMQPYDFRRDRVFLDDRSSEAPVLNKASMAEHRNLRASPVMPTLAPGEVKLSDDSDDSDDDQVINLSQPSAMDSVYDSSKARHLRKSTNPMKRRYNPYMLSGMVTNPTTGKRRVQCTVCLKTFCDKGALKIHYSAVHLREMHQCTVEGCNMMFSSRRSRNRHSANPNPKLHTPNLRRKINPHDGRSAIYYTYAAPLSNSSSITGYPNSSPSKLLEQERSWAMELDQSSNQVLNLTAENNRNYKTNSIYSNSTCDDEVLPLTKDNTSSPNTNNTKDPATINHESSHKTDGSLSGGVRKRKSMKPTKCEVASDEDVQFVSSDDLSSDTFIDQMDDGLDSKSDDGTSDNADNDSSKYDDMDSSPKRQKEEEIKEEPETHSNNSYHNQYSENSKEPNLDKSDHKEEPPENPLRHLESLSLGPFNSTAPPTSKSYLPNSGVIFHAPGLGLGSSPETSRESQTNHQTDSRAQLYPANTDKNQPSSKVMTVQGDFRISSHEIPCDKENPRRCPLCHKQFQNQFGVKTHYQNVHLKVMHDCTVEGCKSSFPSKRSRDRHSANLNLHRKLLSTPSSEKSLFYDKNSLNYFSSPESLYPRLYDPHQTLPLAYADYFSNSRQERLPTPNPHLANSTSLTSFHPAYLISQGTPLPLTRSIKDDIDTTSISSGSSSPPRSSSSRKSNSSPLHDDLSLSKNDHKCELCDRRFMDSLLLKDHYTKHHLQAVLRNNLNNLNPLFLGSKEQNNSECFHQSSKEEASVIS